jgi:hypothetical protein
MRDAFSITSQGYVDFDASYGSLNNKYTAVDMAAAYKNPVNVVSGSLNFTDSRSYGFDGKMGYFLDQKKTWAVVVGMNYFYQFGRLKMDTFHVEYNSTDSKNRAFRQLVSAHPIYENIHANNINVPFMLHYQRKYSDMVFFAVDAGLLYNVSMTYNYAASGSFNYEAVYKYNASTKSFVYDNSPVIEGSGTIPMTIAQYYATNPGGKNLVNYMDQLGQQWGTNIGVNKPISAKNGNVSYRNGKLGLILEPTMNYQMNDNTFLMIGIYYVTQSFNSVGNTNSMQFTNKIGSYNGLLNETKSFSSSTYGISLGIKLLLKDKIDESINYVTQYY